MPLSNQSLQFLFENRLQNSRDWYAEHKAQYQELVLRPMMELVEQLSPAIHEIDPLLIAEPKVDRSISRIYRDTRFSRDKSLYRDVMWCVFTRDKKAYPCSTGFVFEFSPDGFRYGCGYFEAPPRTMEAARGLILHDDRSFRLAAEAYKNQEVFGMEGDTYKRRRYPEQPEWKQQWLDRKCIAFLHNSKEFDLLFSEELSGRVAADFRLLQPMHQFFCRAEEMSRLEGEERR